MELKSATRYKTAQPPKAAVGQRVIINESFQHSDITSTGALVRIIRGMILETGARAQFRPLLSGSTTECWFVNRFLRKIYTSVLQTFATQKKKKNEERKFASSLDKIDTLSVDKNLIPTLPQSFIYSLFSPGEIRSTDVRSLSELSKELVCCNRSFFSD